MTDLPSVEKLHAEPVTASIIWLHGLGADGHDFAGLVPELRLPSDLGVRFIFPHAPQRPVTVNGGYVMRAWYDILDMSLERKVDQAQLLASAQSVHALIDREIARGVDSRRIILAGFSQGGAVAFQAALTYPKPLGGLLALSTYFATADSLNAQPVQHDLPILVMHGTFDSVVPVVLGQRAQTTLTERGYQVRYLTYPMDHSLCIEQVQDIRGWLLERLTPSQNP